MARDAVAVPDGDQGDGGVALGVETNDGSVIGGATADFDLFREGKTLMLAQDGKNDVVETEKHNGYVGELGYFLECVRTKTQPTRVTAQDGVEGLLIVEAEGRSVRSGLVERVDFAPNAG